MSSCLASGQVSCVPKLDGKQQQVHLRFKYEEGPGVFRSTLVAALGWWMMSLRGGDGRNIYLV